MFSSLSPFTVCPRTRIPRPPRRTVTDGNLLVVLSFLFLTALVFGKIHVLRPFIVMSGSSGNRCDRSVHLSIGYPEVIAAGRCFHVHRL